MATGFASTGAAVVTSKFGVGGTIGGAGITAMLATVGATILKSYFESPVGRVDRTRPPMVRFGWQLALDRRSTLVKGLIGAFIILVLGVMLVKLGFFGRAFIVLVVGVILVMSGLFGRMERALGWFRRRPNRRSIFVKGLIGAFLVFVVGMIQVTGVEFAIGNSFSCGFWPNCPPGANHGIHLVADRGTGAGFSILGGRSEGNLVPSTPTQPPTPTPTQPPTNASPQPDPSTSTASPQPDPSTSTASPQPDPSTSTATPGASP